MGADEIYDEIHRAFTAKKANARRRFLPGLFVAIVQLLRRVDAFDGRFASLEDLYRAHPRVTELPGGRRTNTLILTVDPSTQKTESIRGHYDQFVRWVRIEHKRLDYPKAAPHATQAWADYVHWIEALIVMDLGEVETLENRVRQLVLTELPSHDDSGSRFPIEPLRFSLFLDQFDLTARAGEPTGAAYQGTVFGYIRADAAHLQVETNRVRSGGKREKRVGDIDALNGDRLVLSAEVKHYILSDEDAPGFADFANDVRSRAALGLVVALDFSGDAREAFKAMGLEPVSKDDLKNRVRLWDALKQRVAVDALLYYVNRIEQKKVLIDRVSRFFEDIERQFTDAVAPDTGDKDGD